MLASTKNDNEDCICQSACSSYFKVLLSVQKQSSEGGACTLTDTIFIIIVSIDGSIYHSRLKLSPKKLKYYKDKWFKVNEIFISSMQNTARIQVTEWYYKKCAIGALEMATQRATMFPCSRLI